MGSLLGSGIPLGIPDPIAGFFGVFFFGVLSLLIAFGFFFYKILFWESFQLGLAPILIGFFGLTAIQIMIIGLIGEYVSTVLVYSKNLPLVIEKERINFD